MKRCHHPMRIWMSCMFIVRRELLHYAASLGGEQSRVGFAYDKLRYCAFCPCLSGLMTVVSFEWCFRSGITSPHIPQTENSALKENISSDMQRKYFRWWWWRWQWWWDQCNYCWWQSLWMWLAALAWKANWEVGQSFCVQIKMRINTTNTTHMLFGFFFLCYIIIPRTRYENSDDKTQIFCWNNSS